MKYILNTVTKSSYIGGIILVLKTERHKTMIFKITEEHVGTDVLQFLKSVLKISSSALAGLKRDPIGIAVNGRHVTVRYVLQLNDILFINEKDSIDDVNDTIFPMPLDVNIIFENDDIIIADKPPYMPTHPSHGHIDDTLANAISYIYHKRNDPFVFRPIGRLDRNTSGVSMIAKSSVSASFLYHARQKSLIEKKYIAILEGKIDESKEINTIETFMKRYDDSIIIRCVANEDDPSAFQAITYWKLIYSNEKISIVEAIPKTGRTHQLRVHFAHIGHPILGDDVYGSESKYIGRHALHAFSITLPLPYSGEITSFTSPIPQDMINALSALAPDAISIINEQIQKDIICTK